MTHSLFTRIGGLLCAALLLLSPTLHAKPEGDRERQRREFISARDALDRGRLEEFWRLADRLRDYPLHAYLEFDFLRNRLNQATEGEIQRFIDTHGDSPLAGRMRHIWLLYLAQQRKWDRFLSIYEQADTKDTELRCHYLSARLATSPDDSLWDEAEQLWVAGKSQPGSCDAVFDAWRDAGRLTREKVMTRISRAMDRKEPGLARYLTSLLPKEEQAWTEALMRVPNNPSKELEKLRPAKGSAMNATVFGFAVRRLARSDLDEAEAIWQRDYKQYALTVDEKQSTERSLALQKAFRRDADAADRLARLAKQMTQPDKDVRQWRIRAALWKQDWAAVMEGIEALPQSERDDATWRYWRARALEAVGRSDEAQEIYREAATCRCYYGFLAAEHLGEPPALAAVPGKPPKEELAHAETLAAVARARELQELDLTADARREWRHAALHSSGPELRALARIGYEWGWSDLVIHTLAKTEAVNDLELRFPTPFRDEVRAEARDRDLDDAFVYAVMRQESAFNAQARSPVGAMGLMQLMPATAKETARQIKHALRDLREVLEVRNNIRLGTAYLKKLLQHYDGNRIYTMAAYNAGPGRVNRWRPSTGQVPADIWIASITLDETREYVKRILAYTFIYEWRLGRKPTPISHMLPLIEASGASPFRLTEGLPAEGSAGEAEVP